MPTTRATRRSLLAGVASLAVGSDDEASAKGRGTSTPPNIVLVLADDMRATDWKALPRTRKRLMDGTMFPNFFFNVPLCDPSRASILTGQYAQNHGVRWNGREGESSSYGIYQRNQLARRSIPFL
ncbi:MAG: sulfatase-like hydrolase/transferase, partial [Thermomicrobiales bacterium]